MKKDSGDGGGSGGEGEKELPSEEINQAVVEENDEGDENPNSGDLVTAGMPKKKTRRAAAK